MRPGFHILIGAAVVVLGEISLEAAPPTTCPYNIPVVTLAPHQAGGFSWGSVIRPQDDPCLEIIVVDPTNDSAWYVGGHNGLYMTKDGGQTWSHPLSEGVGALLLVADQSQLVYAGVSNKLYLSRDEGKNWAIIGTFPTTISSLLVATSKLYVGLHWSTHAEPSGLFISNLDGSQLQFRPFGTRQTGLIVWTLAQDPKDGTLYAGTEIFDHPRPYHPPFFRSTDGGSTWVDVGGTLHWHVTAATVSPDGSLVYALTEGAGLFSSGDKGSTWQLLASGDMSLSDALLLDPKMPKRLFGTSSGGIFVSTDGGNVFQPIGLDGVTVAGLALNGTSTRLFATAYGSGIYVSPIPSIPQPPLPTTSQITPVPSCSLIVR